MADKNGRLARRFILRL